MTVLVTGGAGYIGSHTVRLLKEKNMDVLVLDNLSTGHKEAVADAGSRLDADAGAGVTLDPVAVAGVGLDVEFVLGDVGDEALLADIFGGRHIDAVMHFAGLSNVGDSVKHPGLYYRENVEKMTTLLGAMGHFGVKKMIFSSSAAIFGEPQYLPIDEEHPKNPVNPYGENKLACEQLLAKAAADYGLKYCALRYFNAAGAAGDGTLGESHNPETHLIPLMMKTALGLRECLHIYGNDYATKDGTCVRDYVHVEDLAEAHYAGMKYLDSGGASACFNLGSASGFTVLEIVRAFERGSGMKVDYEICPRREGDPAQLVASSDKAKSVLDWSPKRSVLDKIIMDAWRWEKSRMERIVQDSWNWERCRRF